MNHNEYYELLRNPKWIARRRDIMHLDNHRCVNCNADKYLQVHHLYYSGNKPPWAYPNQALVTLCKRCHSLEHKEVPNSEFTFENRKVPESFLYFNRKPTWKKSKPKRKKISFWDRPLKIKKKKYSNVKVTIDDYNAVILSKKLNII